MHIYIQKHTPCMGPGPSAVHEGSMRGSRRGPLAPARARAHARYVLLYVYMHMYAYVYLYICLLYTSPSPRDLSTSRMPSSA